MAIIPHRLDVAGLRAVLPAFDRLNHDIVRWWPPSHSGIRGRAWTFNPLLDAAWSLEEDETPGENERRWREGRGVFVSGSRHGHFIFERHAIRLFGPGERWRLFCENPEHRLFVRRVCRGIARIFGADRALYVPDAYLPASAGAAVISSNGTLEEAEARLRARCGPPAASADDIVLGDDERTAGTYFVDRFGDLP